MASIKTLVKDIYGLFEGRIAPDLKEEHIDDLGHRMAGHVRRRINEVVNPTGYNTIRMSNIGTKCRRRLWYRVNTPEAAEQLKASDRIKFLFGDLIEELAIFLAEISGHKVRGKQGELAINGIIGHRDAVIDDVVVDVKSASSRSFEKFENHLTRDNDSFGYIDQLGAYHSSSKDDVDPNVAAFLVIDKQLGKVTLDAHPRSEVDYEKEIEDIKSIVSSPNPPVRYYSDVPDGKSGNRKLCVECSYCEFKSLCWKDSNDGEGLKTYLYSSGPRFLTKVVREPRVDSDG